MNIRSIRKRDVRRFKDYLCVRYVGVCSYVKGFREGRVVEEGNIRLLLLDSEPVAFFLNDELVPTLYLVRSVGREALPSVVVDEGAVKHLLNGADVMVPGIIRVSEFGRDSIVAVWGPDEKAPIVVGKALMSSNEIRTASRGKAIKNLHYAGDKVWRLMLKVLREVSS